MATTTNDAIYDALVVAYPLAGATLGDLLYTFWVEKGLEYRGTLQFEFFKSEGAVGNTLGDLMNTYFTEPSFFVSFNINDAGDILEYEIFGFTYDLRQEIFGW
jgi:hypothetical protein